MRRPHRPPRRRPRESAPALILVGAAALAACGKSTEAAPPGDLIVVTGTCLEAATGAVLAGVVVRGPGETEAISDDHGRFTLPGVPLGEAGWLRAASAGGLVAELPLSPRTPGPREVVFHLRESGE